MSLLKQDITKKKQVNKKTLLESKKKFEVREDKKYKVKAIINSVMYGKKMANNQIPDLYYLVL